MASSLAMQRIICGYGRCSMNTGSGSVLNCAGNCALRACELDSRLAWRTNVEG